jgi:hypothetical protein
MTMFAPSLAAPLTKGSAASPGVNAPGRRQEDDVNLVATSAAFMGGQGSKAGGLGYENEMAPTLKAAASGSNQVPTVLTSSQADSPAKTSPSPESEPDSQASARDFSLSSPGSQMSFDHVGSSLRTSLGSSPLPTDETWESFSQRWPKSGTASAGEWSTLDTSESPNDAVEFSLSDVLETTVSERFALSARAAKGILRRADARGRTLPTELEQALRELAA